MTNMELETDYASVPETLSGVAHALTRARFDGWISRFADGDVIGVGTATNCVIGAHLRSMLGDKNDETQIMGRGFCVWFDVIGISYTDAESEDREARGYELTDYFSVPLPPYAAYISSRNYWGQTITAEEVRFYLHEFDLQGN